VLHLFSSATSSPFLCHRADVERRQSGVRSFPARRWGNSTGSFCAVRDCVAAAEAAVGLGIIILIARSRQTLNVERVDC